jgi:hypothetical protein
MTPEGAMKQASMTSSEYAIQALDRLCQLLEVDRGKKGWQANLAPFAPVWASMIMAATEDFKTACATGAVAGFSPHSRGK